VAVRQFYWHAESHGGETGLGICGLWKVLWDKADVDTNIDPQEKSKSYDTVAGARFQLFRRIENEKELEGRKRERGFSISPEIETKRRERYML
jgi:hypothetical protein